MKYIKTYEDFGTPRGPNIFKRFKRKYEEGDYVLLDITELTKENTNKNYIYDNKGLIHSIYTEHSNFPYTIEFFDGRFENIREEEIIRKLTPDEIDEYKTKKEAKKYNL